MMYRTGSQRRAVWAEEQRPKLTPHRVWQRLKELASRAEAKYYSDPAACREAWNDLDAIAHGTLRRLYWHLKPCQQRLAELLRIALYNTRVVMLTPAHLTTLATHVRLVEAVRESDDAESSINQVCRLWCYAGVKLDGKRPDVEAILDRREQSVIPPLTWRSIDVIRLDD